MPLSSVERFLEDQGVIFDVRSPGEFKKGHIPDAINLPLFSNEERAEIGTLYKQESPSAAFHKGLELVGPKIGSLFSQISQKSNGKPAKIHCWRGGMRSQSVANLAQMGGTQSHTLKGGYKTFRRWVLNSFSIEKPICILGGLSGSGKTEILHCLKELGEQVIDLEDLAKHRGSVYGASETQTQPSQEQFENDLALAWQQVDPRKPVWIEDESRNLGTCFLPPHFFKQMRSAPTLIIEKPRQERIQYLKQEYSSLSIEFLIRSTEKLRKKLGSERTQQIISALQENDFSIIEVALDYYDKTYAHQFLKKQHVYHEKLTFETRIVTKSLSYA